MADPIPPSPVEPSPGPGPGPANPVNVVTENPVVVAAWRFLRMLVTVGISAAIMGVFAAFTNNPGLSPAEIGSIGANAFIAAVIAACGDFLRTWAGQQPAMMSAGRRGATRIKTRAMTVWDRVPI